MATSTFSLFFPPLPSSKGQWEEAAYSYDDHSTVTTLSPSSPASSASSGSLVDCTLSLGTPSTRCSEPDRRPPQGYTSVSAAAEPCYYHQQQGRGGAAGHDQLLDRRCANCGTASTPLWRNGPRGPKSLCNACGIRFKKEERRAAETNAGGSGGGCGYVAHRAHVSSAPTSNAPPHAMPYAEEALPYAEAIDAPFLAWRLNGVPPAPAFSVWPEMQHGVYQYN